MPAEPVMTPFSTIEKRIPMGMAFLSAVLKKEGHHVFFIDNYLEPQPFLENGYLGKNKIDLAGVSANTICLRDTLRMLYLMQDLRERKKWTGKIVVGGPHASVAPETIPEFVDYVVIGEGENAIRNIANGTVTDRLIHCEPMQDLDSLPRPDWEIFISLEYDWTVEQMPECPVFPMNTSRGCPFRCTFCSVGSVWGKKYNSFSAGRIVDDIAYLVDRYGARGIYFREDNFTFSRKRVEEFCSLLLKKRIRIKWVCESRVNNLDEELLKLMRRAGCAGLYLGLESGSQRILDYLKKDITLEQAEQVLRISKKLSISTYGSFITNVPTETDDDRQATQDFISKGLLDSWSINCFVGIPRSPLYENLLQSDNYDYIDERGLVYPKNHDRFISRYYDGLTIARVPGKPFEDRFDFTNHETQIGLKFNPSSGLLPNFKTEDFILRHRFLDRYTNPGDAVLDVNSYAGFSSYRIAASEAHVTGLSTSNTEIAFASNHFTEKNLQFALWDGQTLPFKDDSFDIVVSIDWIEQLAPDSAIKHVSEAWRVLKPGGRLIGTVRVFTDEIYTQEYLKPYLHQVLDYPLRGSPHSIEHILYRHFFDMQFFHTGKFLTFVATKLDGHITRASVAHHGTGWKTLDNFVFSLAMDMVMRNKRVTVRRILLKYGKYTFFNLRLLCLLIALFLPQGFANRIKRVRLIRSIWERLKGETRRDGKESQQ